MIDMISREEFERRIKPYDTDDPMDKALYNFAHNKMTDCPSVEPERKVGKWLLTIEDWNKWTCSECGFSKRTDIHVTLGYDYCPMCGSRMEVDG